MSNVVRIECEAEIVEINDVLEVAPGVLRAVVDITENGRMDALTFKMNDGSTLYYGFNDTVTIIRSE